MTSIIVISLFFVVIILSIKPTNSYDPCSSKIYKLSYGRIDNLLVEAHINVIEHEDILGYHLNITLIGHNVSKNKDRKIKLRFQRKDEFFIYTCTKFRNGLTDTTIATNLFFESSGSSIYLPNRLICWWITDIKNNWPSMDGKPMDLINECDYQIYLVSDKTSTLVARNGQDVPTCGMKYTKCSGNQNYGNNNYSLVIKPNDYSIAFYLQVKIDNQPVVTEVKLASSDGTRISIICNHTEYVVFGHISDNFDSPSIPLSQLNLTKISNTECAWKLPRVLFYGSKSWEIYKTEFELSIIADNSTVYQENHVKLTNYKKISVNLIVIIFPIVIILMLMLMLLFVLYKKLFFHIIYSISFRARSQSNTSASLPQSLELRQRYFSSAQLK